MRSVLIALLLALPSTSRAAGQLAPGDTVRVWSLSGRHMGRVVAAPADSLRLRRGHDTVTVALSEVRRMEIAHGREPRLLAAARGAVKGVAIGGLIGLVGGLAMVHNDCPRDQPVCNDGQNGILVLATTYAGAVSGFTLGAVFGVTSPHARWERVRAPGNAAATPGVTVGVHLRL